ncbi:hypothetical protein ACJ2A9_14720 [Anaerobacillus sp. MEB173]|uniref:hypothetical protein n=1 Tax=Anaerobacillus sp. MEB173 TaxID=3383345 RepID=UPI003F923837
MRFITIILLLSLLLTGCSFGEDEAKRIDTISQLKPKEEGQYHMFVFFDFPDNNVVPPEPTARGNVDEYLQRQYDVHDTMMVTMNPAMKVHQFGVRNANENPEQIDFLNIEEFPTFVILDNTGIVLLSTDMDETAEFLQTLPDL